MSKKRKVNAGTKLTTKQLKDRTNVDPTTVFHVEAPPDILPLMPKKGDRVCFIYEYEPAGWKQIRIERTDGPGECDL